MYLDFLINQKLLINFDNFIDSIQLFDIIIRILL